MVIRDINTMTNVINKDVVESDKVLDLNELGNDIKVTCVSNIGRYSLDRCILKILESNPNIIFNTIQYSKRDGKLYFYTNSEIDIQFLEEKNKTLNSEIDILNEIKDVLETPLCKRNDCISLYDISRLVKDRYFEFEKSKEYYTEKLRVLLNENLGNVRVYLYQFDYDNDNLEIDIEDSLGNDYADITITKKDGELIIVTSKYNNADEIINVAGELISKIYDRMLEFKDFEKQCSYDISPVNSNFVSGISKYGVNITNKNNCWRFKLLSPSYHNNYDCKSDSYDIRSVIENKEDELFKRIFVKLDDCPEWMRSYLYVKRQGQLADYLYKEKKKEEKEVRRTRRKNRIKKIFSNGNN